MWVKLNEYSQDDLFNTFKKIREGKYTYENICKYLIEKQIDVIPQLLYNKDMYQKYISQGRQYLHMLHGNNKDHLKRWLYNRFQYVDSLFLQHNSPYTKQSITIRSCAPADAVPKTDGEGNIISPYTARFEIQTYVPQYVTVCWRKNTFETKRVNWNETVVFENDMVNSQDNELIVYCANNLKHLGDISGLNPTSIDIGNATRLIEFVCEDSDKLVKADLSKNSFLKKASFKGCSVMGTASGGSNVLDVTGCTNLKELDIRGTQITSLLTNTEGGNLEKVLYPEAIQNIVLSNQINLEVIGLPLDVEQDIYAKNLSSVTILNCENVKALSYPYKEGEPVNFNSLKYVQNLTLSNSIPSLTELSFDGFSKLRNINVYTMPQITSIKFTDLLPATEVSTFKKLTLANIPQVDTISFNVTSDDYKIAFADGAEVNLGGLTSCHTIESNYSIKGLNRLIVPLSLKELRFTTEYGDGSTEITNIWSNTASHIDDGFTGLDFLDMSIDYIDMTGLPNITSGINLNLSPVTQPPNLNVARDGSAEKPYFRPQGRINLDRYTGDMTGLLKGLDLSIFTVEMNVDKEQTDLTRLFEAALVKDNMPAVNRILNRFPASEKWNYLFTTSDITTPVVIPSDRTMYLKGMYKDTHITEDTDLPTKVADVSEMYMNCLDLTEATYKNWEKEYYPSNGVPLTKSNGGYWSEDGTYNQNNNDNIHYTGNVTGLDDISIIVNGTGYIRINYFNGDTFIKREYEGSVTFVNASRIYSIPAECTKIIFSIDRGMTINSGSIALNPTDCYKNSGIDLGEVPMAWGGYEFSKATTSILELVIPEDNYTLTLSQNNILADFDDGQTSGYNKYKIINWGDGTITVGEYSHTYATAGTYTFKGHYYMGQWEPTATLKICLYKIHQIPRYYRWGTSHRLIAKGCKNLIEVTLNNFITNTDDYGLHQSFYGCSKLQKVTIIADTPLYGLDQTFHDCTSLMEINGVETWDLSATKKLDYTFCNCQSLTDEQFAKLSNLDVSNIISYSNTFYNCKLMTTNRFMDKWVMTKASNLNATFEKCTGLTEFILTNKNIPIDINMTNFLKDCSSLTTLDLTNLCDTTKQVTLHIFTTFNGCSSLTENPYYQLMQNGCIDDLDFRGLTSLTDDTFDCSGYNTSKIKSIELGEVVSKVIGISADVKCGVSCRNAWNKDVVIKDYYMKLGQYDWFYYGIGESITSIDVNFVTKEGEDNPYKADNFNIGLGISYMMKLTNSAWTVNSFVSLFNCLYDYASEGSSANYTITIGSTNLAKLTDEQIAIATNKGWTVS